MSIKRRSYDAALAQEAYEAIADNYEQERGHNLGELFEHSGYHMPRRNDVDVICLRNFKMALFELDKLTQK